MSNEYKEWKKDRAEEAWVTLTSIVELFELGEPKDAETGLSVIKTILKEDGWL